MANRTDIIVYLDDFLDINSFQHDSSLNGLQVESDIQEISVIAGAVDSGLSIFEEACALNAQMIIVHHGIFWGNTGAISGVIGKQVRYLISHGLSLYASHLPLDGHETIGNAAKLAELLKIQVDEPFLEDGMPIGVYGHFKETVSIEEVEISLKEFFPGLSSPLKFPFGPKNIKTVCIASGSASFAVVPASKRKTDLLITGEPNQASYHASKDHYINVIFAGHYWTETLGIKALLERLSQHFPVSTVFIECPTGI